MKRLKKLDFIFIIILVAFLATRLPSIIEGYSLEGKKFGNIQLTLLDKKITSFDELAGPKILIFWATWCPPCKVEIKRFNDAIKNKEIPSEKIFFVNIRENEKLIKKFMNENDYSFNVAIDPYGAFANRFNVKSTPTVIYLNSENEIDHYSTGISPLGIYRAKWLFN